MSVSEYFKAQAGKESRFIEFVILIAVLVMMMILIGLTLYTEQPYVLMIDYRYKSQYYEPFVLPDDYDIDTQGRAWSNWDVDETGIMKVCNLFNASMGYFNTKRNSSATRLGKRLLEEWIIAYLAELEKTDIANEDFNAFPWGGNWYEFTITSTTTMAYYIMLKDSLPSVKASCAKAIQLIIKDPQTSLGWKRDKANSAMMILPYTLAHKITGTLDTSIPEYQYAIDQYDISPDPTLMAKEDGVHIDYAYLTHNGVYAFGYLDSIYNIYPDTMQVIPEVKASNLEYYIDQIDSILKHPTIPLSGATLYHRREEVAMGLYKGSTKRPDIYIMPSMRYIRYFTKDWQWCARASQRSIAYYESDQHIQNMGLYSILDRSMYRKGETDATAKFPRCGFISKLGTTELPKVPHENVTTQPHYGQFSENTKSYVFTDFENYAVIRSWMIKCPGLIDVFFDETIILDIKEQKATIYYWTGKDHYKEWQICMDNVTNVQFPDTHLKVYIDFKANTYSGEPYEGYTPTLAEMTNDMFSDKFISNNGISIISRNEGTRAKSKWVPFCVTPGEDQVLNYEPYEIDGHTFKFDPEFNQFMYAPTEFDVGSDVSPQVEDLREKEGIR